MLKVNNYNSTACIPNNCSDDLVRRQPTLAFFGARSLEENHCLNCSFVYGVVGCIIVSSTVTNIAKYSCALVTRLLLRSSVSSVITRIALSCLNIHVICDLPAQLKYWCMYLKQCHNIPWFLSIISSVVTSFGGLKRLAGTAITELNKPRLEIDSAVVYFI